MFDDTLKHLFFVDNKILLTKEQLVSLFKQIYNEALIVAADNAEADYEMTGNWNVQVQGDIEVYVIKNSILQFKL